MTDVSSLFWRAVSSADFFNIERRRDAGPSGGGGQSYISISFSGLTYQELGEFLGLADPMQIKTARPRVQLEDVKAIQNSLDTAPLVFAPRYQLPQADERYRISTQNRQFQKRHPGWSAKYGFPQAPDDVTGPHDLSLPDLSHLKVWVAKTTDDEYFAGFVNAAGPPAWVADRPSLAGLFEEFDPARSAGVIEFDPGELALDALVDLGAGPLGDLAEKAPEVLDAIEFTRKSAGKRSGGQGRRQNAAERRAIELRAMEVATDHLKAGGWKVDDVSLFRSYDLHCVRRGSECRIEVKGTTGDGSSVLLTPGEVVHARDANVKLMLLIVSGIELIAKQDEDPTASGGTLRIIDPWRIDEDGTLTPTGFEYKLV